LLNASSAKAVWLSVLLAMASDSRDRFIMRIAVFLVKPKTQKKRHGARISIIGGGAMTSLSDVWQTRFCANRGMS
jgi:hypothetical protein